MAESESSNIEGHGSARKTRWFRWSIFTFILILVGAWGFQTLKTYWFYVHETDARIVADMISISSQVSGRILERPVDMGSQVQRGDLLAVIDGREVSLKVEQLTAQLSRNDARQEEVLAKVAMTEERIAAQNVLHMGKLKTAEASLQFVEYDVSFYENELQRTVSLYESGIATQSEVDLSRKDFSYAQERFVRAQEAVATAYSETKLVAADEHQLTVLQNRLKILEHEKVEIEAKLGRETLNLVNRRIVSPQAGVISRTFAEVGEFVAPGRRLILLHDPSAIYVEANIRETDIRRLKLGQNVLIEVDAYPSMPLSGVIDHIGDAATSQFSLLPSVNPSGNFTKVTQRLPVKIVLTDASNLLRPGMMVEVYVSVRER